jgi:hypothetical protein
VAADTLVFTDAVELSWADYLGRPNGMYDLRTACGIYLAQADYAIKERYIHIKIKTGGYFDTRRSIAGAGAQRRREILDHEKYRVKLVCLGAMRFMTELKQRESQLSHDNVYEAIRKIYTNVKDDLQKEIDRFDAETEYGIKIKAELKWEGMIDEQMERLKLTLAARQ